MDHVANDSMLATSTRPIYLIMGIEQLLQKLFNLVYEKVSFHFVPALKLSNVEALK